MIFAVSTRRILRTNAVHALLVHLAATGAMNRATDVRGSVPDSSVQVVVAVAHKHRRR